MEPPTALFLPRQLPYPLTVQRLLRPATEPHPAQARLLEQLKSPALVKTDSLLTYSFRNTHGEREVRVWESPVAGELQKWCIDEGQLLLDASEPVVLVQESCTHPVQYAGQCAICGKDLSAVDYTGFSDTSRANIRMAHENGELTVSLQEAHRLETQTTDRLLSTKKLSLIVDLDQTIVHATVDPTVGDWLNDERNPNFKALDGTGKFQLGREAGQVDDDSCWYYVKMRPGLNEFLKTISSMYEMHVYTMGTRAYASEVCKIVDPDGGLFGGRILSRDESGSMTRKSLQRLFPCDTSMVVIIDDRADVWDGSPNLVKVIPYEFFVGIGDINAAFLPKKQDLVLPTPGSAEVTPTASPDSSIISPSLSDASISNAKTLLEQIESRPLAHQAHSKAKGSASPSASSHASVDEIGGDIDVEVDDVEEEMAVLKNDDRELDRIFTILKDVHTDFFAHASAKEADVKDIIPAMKRRVLQGVVIVFSGVIALGARPSDSEYWKLAVTFGARCQSEVNSRVTHLVANQGGTQKVHMARRIKGASVVWAQWLLDCTARWTRLPEQVYHLAEDTTIENAVPVVVEPFIDMNPVASTSSLPTPEEPLGPTIEQEERDSRNGSVLGDPEDLDLDWGDASKEVDDFLNETDDDDEGGGGDETDGNLTDDSNSNGKKRARVQTDSEDDLPPIKAPPPAASPVAIGSPLSKRIKKSKLRKSGLKVVSFEVEAAPDPSQGSSVVDSDEEAFLASMAADVEAGWK